METPLSPLELARRARCLYSERIAIIDDDENITYQEFFSRCDKFSFLLQGYGIKQGDRVAYICPNTLPHLEGYYALPQIGAIIVPINYRLSDADFVYIINHCQARILCIDNEYLENIEAIKDKLPSVEKFILLNKTDKQDKKIEGWINYETSLKSAETVFTPATINESDVISINYTSGTTARPKGVMLTHRNAYLNIMGALAHTNLSMKEKFLWTVPMFHVNGWGFVWLITAIGASHVCLRKVDPDVIFKIIKNKGITLFCAAPTVLISLANACEATEYNLPSNVQLFTGGAAPAPSTIDRIANKLGWKINHIYGLTETSPFITICESRPEHNALSTQQQLEIQARQGVEFITAGEVRVVDKNDNDVAKDGQSIGEIIVRGNVVMKGYYGDKQATDNAFRNGWFHSGDAAVVHHDGYIEIKDRFKDVIISGGENISSLEIERVLLNHAKISEAAVVGMPHQKWGEAPHAFIVLKQNTQLSEEEVIAFCETKLARFKIPKKISFIENLPKTTTGKIQKYRLRQEKTAVFKQ